MARARASDVLGSAPLPEVFLKVAWYPRPLTAAPGEVLDVTWEDLVARLSSWHVGSKDSAPGWAPHACEGPRSNAGVSALSCLVVDVDGATDAVLARVVGSLEGLAHLVHTTHSHAPGVNCMRAVVPFAQPVPAARWAEARAACFRALGIADLVAPSAAGTTPERPIDPTRDAARFYYVPSSPSEGAERDMLVADGDSLDVQLPPPSAPAGASARADTSARADGGGSSRDMAALREAVRRGEWGPCVLDGAPIGRGPGRNHDDLLSCFNELARRTLDFDPLAVLELLQPSFAHAGHYGTPPEEEFWRMFPDQRGHWLSVREQRRAEVDAARRALQRGARAQVEARAPQPPEQESIFDQDGKYTGEAVARWAAEQGCTPEEFQKRWIISKEGAHFFFVAGRYQAAVAEQDAEARALLVLRPAPVRLEDVTEKDGVVRAKPRSMKALRNDYGTPPLKIRGSLMTERSYYDVAADAFVEAFCPPRALGPVEHPRIGEWLRCFALGEDYEALLDWMATYWDLSRGTSALYLAGPAASGKSMLALGLSKLWSEQGFTEMDNFVGAFNSGVMECPLVFADEELPQDVKNVTAVIRRMLGNPYFELRRKFLPSVMVAGYPRLVIAANDDRLFEKLRGSDLNSASVEAVAQRIRVIKARVEAREFLDRLPPHETDSWATHGDKIAEHAAFLRQTRRVDTRGRFLVPGKMAEMHQVMSISNYAGAVLQFIVRAFENLDHPQVKKFMRFGAGELMVQGSLFQEQALWDKFIGQEHRRNAVRAAEALREHLSWEREQVRPERGGPRYYRLKTDLLYLWIERNGIGDRESIQGRIDAS